MGIQPWKVVTLTQNYDTPDVVGQKFWMDFLGISEQTDFDQYAYVCLFDNNSVSSVYQANALVYRYDFNSNVVGCTILRSRFTYANNVTSSANNYYFFANAGTQISVYKITL